MKIEIRKAVRQDFEKIWPIFHAVVVAGDTYAYDPATTRKEAADIWMSKPQKTYVALDRNHIVGTYFLTSNQPGLGSHVCNCGYMVAEKARRQGIATMMCQHSQQEALKLGYKAMQFNLVVATNNIAIRLWQKLGFKIVATLPRAFQHKRAGFVDAHIMYKWLEGEGT